MDDKDYITRFEYEERQKRIDDEDRRQNHRLDKLETITDQIAEMAASIKAMVVTMQSMQKEQEEQGSGLQTLRRSLPITGINWFTRSSPWSLRRP